MEGYTAALRPTDRESAGRTARCSPACRIVGPFNHDDDQHAALAPPAEPAYAPGINVIAQLDGPAKSQELRFNVHSPLRTCMALWKPVNASIDAPASEGPQMS